MPTFNMNIDMGPEEAVDSINGYFEKVAQWFVGDMEPDIKLPMQVWVDAYNGVIKQRNLENTAWIVRAPLSGMWGMLVGTMITLTGLPSSTPGFVMATGTTLIRADYPLLWNFAANQSNNIVTDAEWFSQERYYSYSYGDGATTFRIPQVFDFVRGYDPASGVAMGQWRQDRMQRIIGNTSKIQNLGAAADAQADVSGAFTYVHMSGGNSSGAASGGIYHFDSANSPGARTSETADGETWPCHGVLPKLIYTGEVW